MKASEVYERLGASEADRIATLIEKARVFGATGTVVPRYWRKPFINAVARELGDLQTAYYIDAFFNTLTSEQLKRIRVACIGEDAERSVFGERTVRGKARTNAVDAEAERARKVREAYDVALKGLPPGERTIAGLARAMNRDRTIVAGYCHANPDFASQLKDGGALRKTG
ncbi:MAG: hypothetical protein JO019_01180 [Candidatus Kaiserbacteria bacterium]|nr:hypothetical protein [Candidatus Kaiserbacteria bacterium]